MGTKGKKAKWTPRKVGGKVQRARTYTPGYDVICVRAPSPIIDRIRSQAKKLDVSISQLVCDAFGGKREGKPAKKKASKKAPTVGASTLAKASKPADPVAQA